MAGTTFPIDREMTAKEMGFEGPSENSVDTIGDRDHLIETDSAAAICMMHLSRLCEEIVLFTSQDIHFFELSDDFCTGSSIMPNKKNPDIAEKNSRKSGACVRKSAGNANDDEGVAFGIQHRYE